MSLTKWVIGMGATLGLGLAAYGIVQATQSQSSAEEKVAVAPASSIDNPVGQISALGRITPEGEVFRVGGPSGARIESLTVKEGDVVTKSQVIAVLNTFDERNAERDLAQKRLEEAKLIFATEEQLGVLEIQEAETRLQQAKEPKFQAIRSQKAQIQRIQVELQQAKQDLQRFTSLMQKGAITLQTLENWQLAVRQREEDLEAANARLLELQQQQAADERNVLAQIESVKARSIKSQAEIQINSAISELRLAEARLAQTIIRSPLAGQVIKVHLRAGESIEPAVGEGGAGQTIVELGRTQQMFVVAEVYETDIAAIKPNMKAKITSPAFDGEILGVVDSIGLQIGKNDVLSTDPAANTDTRVIEVKIRLQDSQKVTSLTNLQVNVLIDPTS